MLGWRRSRRFPRSSDTRVGSVPWTARDWGGSGSRTASRPREAPRGEATDTATATGMDAPLRTWMCLSRAADMEVRMSTKLDVDVTELWREFKEHPTTPLRNRLVEQYLPLVKYNGERIWARLPDGVELDDLISAGVFGLMDAIDAFDLTRGVKFETYCVPAHPRGHARRAADDGLGAAAGAQQGQQAERGPQDARGRSSAARPPRTSWPSTWACRVDELEKMIIDANAVNLDQPQQEVVRDRQLQGRPRDRHPRRQEGRRPDAAASRSAT